MQRLFITSLSVFCLNGLFAQDKAPAIITDDIGHFWTAYDSIRSTTDSARKYAYLEKYFLSKGSPGLRAFMERKEYTPESYIEAINNYPLFWASVRANTYKGQAYGREIALQVEKLRALYPELRPAEVYFTIGALRSNGSTLDGRVLIGAEFAMADEHTVTSEFPEWLRESLTPFFATDPIAHLVFLNVHEYVHTQQRTQGGYDLLSQCLYEGVPEFVAVKAMGIPSPTPAIAFGQANDARIKERFEEQMFSPHFNDWLYNNFQNIFQMRDLGYYVGYAICERHYERSTDKARAIKELIELNYADPVAIERFVEGTGYFSKPPSVLKTAYEKAQPTVLRMREFTNGDTAVASSIATLTIEFSAPMDARYRGFDHGPLGEDASLRIQRFVSLSEDGRTMVLEITLEPGRRHQLVVSSQFRSMDGLPLKPYLVDIRTAE